MARGDSGEVCMDMFEFWIFGFIAGMIVLSLFSVYWSARTEKTRTIAWEQAASELNLAFLGEQND
ncbi:MAG: hypothetical protein JJ992_16040, partial [Planctomycetes bacterium]|nr:hypothetical protein [Planctomycetota bacterium]